MDAAAEHEEKLDRVRRIAREGGLHGILLATHHNIAWLTNGRGNRIDASRETGTARLLVAADGRRFVLANAIEMPRLLAEELAGFEYTPIEYPWTEDQDASRAIGAARSALNDKPALLGADWPLPDCKVIEPMLMRARARLTDGDIDRYRALGRDAGAVLGEVCRSLKPGEMELDIARRVADAAAGFRARAIVVLVGSDDRLRHFRHPVPTDRRWRQVVMTALCAERDGLIVSLSRIVAAGAVADLDMRTRATASVFERVLGATRPGTTARQLYATLVAAYADAGFPGEERQHHQGGAIGYRAREWVAHPASAEVVQERQAFAWNPTITGTKIEDTALVIGDRVEIITATPRWPALDLGDGLRASAVLHL